MYIVTGGAGFIGSAFVWKLNRMGIDDVLIVDNLGCGEKWKNLVGLKYRDYIHKEEFRAMLEADALPESVDAVIHMGACSATSETDADYLMENNYRYTISLAQWAVENDVRFVYASSAATYGGGENDFDDSPEVTPKLSPTNMYGYSKHLADLWAMRSGALDKIAGIKFFNVFGPNEYHKGEMSSVLFKACNQIKVTGKLKLFKSLRPEYEDGGQKRDFVYVKDCVDVMWWLLENPGANGLFNLGTGTARSWNDLGRAVFAAMDVDPKIEYIDMPEHLRGHYQYFTEAKMDRLRAAGCDIKFTSLEDAAADYVRNHLLTDKPHLRK